MIKSILYVNFLFFKTVFVGENNNKIANELLRKRSFRIPDALYNKKHASFGFVYRLLFQLLNSTKNDNISPTNSIIYDALIKSKEIRINHLKSNNLIKDENYLYVAKEELFSSLNNFEKILLIINILVTFPILLTLHFKKVKSSEIGLLTNEFAENIVLDLLIKKANPSSMFFFGVAERDSNFSYHSLKKNNSKLVIFKFPSPGALVAHNKYLRTDILALCSKYQKEEFYNELHKTIKCKNVIFVKSEFQHNYENLYQNSTPKSYNFKLGFYSHAGWLRKSSGNTNALFAKGTDEEIVLGLINSILKNKNEQLLIFLHPKEKNELINSEKYYSKILPDINFKIYDGKLSSSESFDLVEIGVGAYSTILFERDNMNRKVIIYRVKDFPIPNTEFYKKSFNNQETLLKCITKTS